MRDAEKEATAQASRAKGASEPAGEAEREQLSLGEGEEEEGSRTSPSESSQESQDRLAAETLGESSRKADRASDDAGAGKPGPFTQRGR